MDLLLHNSADALAYPGQDELDIFNRDIDQFIVSIEELLNDRLIQQDSASVSPKNALFPSWLV